MLLVLTSPVVDKSIEHPAILSQHNGNHASMKSFTALPDDRTVLIGPRRVPPVTSPASNTDTSISISTSTGFQTLFNEDYVRISTQLKPDIAVGLGDVVIGAQLGRKRREKMVVRTEKWTKSALEQDMSDSLDSEEPLRFPYLAPIVPIAAEEQALYLQYFANGADSPMLGFVLYEQLQPLPVSQTLSHLLRVNLAAFHTPHQLLDAVSSGCDLLTASFLGQATDAGVALCFSLRSRYHGKDIKKNTEKSALGLDMWSADLAVDMAPVVDGCDCYTCQKHSRAYIQHLLNAKEMLAWTLLQLHNIQVMELFFAAMRTNITERTFEESRDAFHASYEPDLPEKSGQGPR